MQGFENRVVTPPEPSSPPFGEHNGGHRDGDAEPTRPRQTLLDEVLPAFQRDQRTSIERYAIHGISPTSRNSASICARSSSVSSGSPPTVAKQRSQAASRMPNR